MAKEVNPRLVFDRLFGHAARDGLAGRPAQTGASTSRASSTSSSRTPGSSTPQLGTNDRRKIDEYLTSVREIERRIAPGRDVGAATPADARMRPGPAGSPTTSASTSG